MPSQAEVTAFRRAQAAVAAAAKGNLVSFWRGLNVWEVAEVRDALEQYLPALVAEYGNAAASLAATWFEQLTGSPAVLGDGAAEAAVNARMRWALGGILRGDPDQALATLGGILDELVKGPGRDTIRRSSAAAGIGWARVPSGSETCAFCLVLASRGAVYESRRAASTKSNGSKFHGDCDCVATPIRDDGDLPAGYDPDALYARYNAARADADSGDAKQILAAMRQREGIH